MGYLAMLVSWEVWKERNVFFFKNHSSTVKMVVAKSRMRLCYDPAKALYYLMLRE
jgi:hypothetical protein